MNLAMFFTRNVSLEEWVKTGLFFREKLIYEEHLKQKSFNKIYWITYGCNDKVIAERLKISGELSKNIEVLDKPFWLKSKIGSLIFSFIATIIHFRELSSCSVFKSNQLDGAWSAFISSLIFHGKFFLRTGYTLSIFIKKQNESTFKYNLVRIIEAVLFKFADAIAVSSEFDKDYVAEAYKPFKKVNILYNYIDDRLFNDYGDQRMTKLVFVGRMNKQKNLDSLLKACITGGFSIDLYGDGEEIEILKLNYSSNLISFKGRVPNNLLPAILNKYKFYILSSDFEGMPKTLLEAMACGCYCIGTNVQGINELISNENGLLLESGTPTSIAEGIKKAYSDICYNEKKEKSKTLILEKFSLKSIVRKETQMLLKGS